MISSVHGKPIPPGFLNLRGMTRIREIGCLAALTLAGLLSAQATRANNIENIEAYVTDYQEMAAFDGVVLIAEGDEIVWQKAFGFAD